MHDETLAQFGRQVFVDVLLILPWQNHFMHTDASSGQHLLLDAADRQDTP